MTLPFDPKLPVDRLSAVFNNTTNSYKFYWFLAILELIQTRDSDEFSFGELNLRMFNQVWYPITFYRLSFGKSDSFKTISDYLRSKVEIDNSINSPDLYDQIEHKLSPEYKERLSQMLLNLARWVPYRFIRPFFEGETRGLPDHQVNRAIIRTAYLARDTDKSPYYFRGNYIVINRAWREYFTRHLSILRDFSYYNLIRFLQKNNPNVSGISEKIFKPEKRNLTLNIRAWKTYFEIKRADRCFYSGLALRGSFSLDHFIPWSFTVHDLNWNIVPVRREINSSKSDALPDKSNYLKPFIKTQYDFFNTLVDVRGHTKIKEQYILLFNKELNEIKSMPYRVFEEKFNSTLSPLIEIAGNMGFRRGWRYSEIVGGEVFK